ncbi:4'-phosphopantetheinyl transferase Npt [Rothia dentocariosa]|nr:4'-phosphopantetheinyl transferase Npt [Rothia dentocariosa]
MVNRVNAVFDDMKGSENTGGTENSLGLEHMSTAENSGESLMRSLLPPDICVAETTGDFGHLRDAEREYFASAVPKRVREATTARSCARLALKRLYLREPELTELPTEPIFVPRADGSPAWPAGVVGSMTHCAGYRAAAVASAHRYAGIGIDVEPAVPLSAAVQELIVREEERRFAFGVYSKVLFSAKEAALKTWYPLGFRGFDVSDISVACDVESAAERRGEDARGTFTARIPTMPDAPVLHGGWAIGGGFVATAASLSVSDLPASR